MSSRPDRRRNPSFRDSARREEGSILVEVLVSALLLVITAVGVFNAFDAATRSSAEGRFRSQAQGLAQADVARMRTMRISDLSNLDETRYKVIDGTRYRIDSDATFQTDTGGTASCSEGDASADYIEIRSRVTWPSIGSRPPVIAQSLVAPPNGSISPESGSLAVQIENAENVGIEGVQLVGTGDGSFSGETGSNGCAIFGNLPAGNYTLSVVAPNLVDGDGNPPASKSTSVVAESTNTIVLQYDEPGEIGVDFETRAGGELAEPVPSSADSIVVFNSGMTEPRAFGTPGEPLPKVTATNLFPYTSPYAVYAGTCEGNNPNPPEGAESPAIADALVSAGGATTVTIELPALHLAAWSGTGAAEAGEPVQGAKVVVTDTLCGEEEPVVRIFSTNEEGGLDDPGLPVGTYDICVSDGSKHVSFAGLDLPEDPAKPAAGSALDVYLGNPEAEVGACP